MDFISTDNDEDDKKLELFREELLQLLKDKYGSSESYLLQLFDLSSIIKRKEDTCSTALGAIVHIVSPYLPICVVEKSLLNKQWII